MTTTMSGPVPAPSADWVDPAELAADPHPTYERLRETGPVVWAPSLHRYLITGYAECQAIEADQQTFSAACGGTVVDRATGGTSMMRKDDPDHAAERATLNPAMRPKAVRTSWHDVFERNAREYLQALVDVGPDEADLNRDFAAPLAARNLTDMLGFPDIGPEIMTRWSRAVIAGASNILDDQETWAVNAQAQQEMDETLDAAISRCRTRPDGSIISALTSGELDDTAVRANVKLIIGGGLQDPQHMVTAMVWALTLHPEQRALVLAEPSRWPDVFDETLRWLSPIGHGTRETTIATVLAGVDLPEGATIGMLFGAANRDPAVFDDPGRFDITRTKKVNFGFGGGVHICAGQWAARLSVGEVAVPMLYDRLPSLRTDERRPAQWRGWIARGLTALPVTW